jgi:glutamate/tyrosine decarboxylase-like PLP-dependent enzyme
MFMREAEMTAGIFDYITSAAKDYMDTIASRHVAPTQEALDNLSVFDESTPQQATAPLDVLTMLETYGSPATMATTGPRFFGFVQGGALPVTIASNWLSTAWDQNAAPYILSPISAKLEEVAARWILDLIDLPRDAGVGFVTGASMGAFSAIAVARNKLLENAGYDVRKQGLYAVPPIRVVVSAEIHPMNLKALSYLGIGEDQLEYAPCDRQGRVIPDQLPEIDNLTIVLLQAGNINSGAFDPFGAISEIVHAHGGWVHIDGAFGAWARVSPTRRYLAEGMESANSWSFDCHKWLNVPYDSAVYICRDERYMRKVFGASASYLVESDRREPHHYTPELSRRARGVDVWAALKSLGREGVAQVVDRCCNHAATFARGLADMGFEVLNDVCLNQVVATYGDEAQTLEVMRRIQETGVLWLGPTHWQGRDALRVSVSSWVTSEDDVTMSLEAIRGCLPCGKG